MPVSYTHLDVYKRQLYNCAAEAHLVCFQDHFQLYLLSSGTRSKHLRGLKL